MYSTYIKLYSLQSLTPFKLILVFMFSNIQNSDPIFYINLSCHLKLRLVRFYRILYNTIFLMDLRNFRDYSFQLLGHSFYYSVLGGARFRLSGGGGGG